MAAVRSAIHLSSLFRFLEPPLTRDEPLAAYTELIFLLFGVPRSLLTD